MFRSIKEDDQSAIAASVDISRPTVGRARDGGGVSSRRRSHSRWLDRHVAQGVSESHLSFRRLQLSQAIRVRFGTRGFLCKAMCRLSMSLQRLLVPAFAPHVYLRWLSFSPPRECFRAEMAFVRFDRAVTLPMSSEMLASEESLVARRVGTSKWRRLPVRRGH